MEIETIDKDKITKKNKIITICAMTLGGLALLSGIISLIVTAALTPKYVPIKDGVDVSNVVVENDADIDKKYYKIEDIRLDYVGASYYLKPKIDEIIDANKNSGYSNFMFYLYYNVDLDLTEQEKASNLLTTAGVFETLYDNKVVNKNTVSKKTSFIEKEVRIENNDSYFLFKLVNKPKIYSSQEDLVLKDGKEVDLLVTDIKLLFFGVKE